MIKIYLETGKKTTSEYVFIETLLRVLGLDKSYQIECVNKDDGDFETLISKLVLSEKHKRFFDCYGDYEKCLGTEYVSPNLKGKLFTYISAIPMSKSKRDRLGQGQWFFDNKDYWNLECEALDPLKKFLKDC